MNKSVMICSLIQNGDNTQELHEMMDSTAAELDRTSEVLTGSEGVGVMRATLSEDHREEDYPSRSIRLICLAGTPNRNELHWESPSTLLGSFVPPKIGM